MLLALALGMPTSLLVMSMVLWNRAGVRAPPEIRTMSGRSTAEHEFRKRVRGYREGSVACLLAGAFTLILFAAIGLIGFQIQ
jgi:hypothetical protein